MQKASGYNTVEVCRAVEAELERINHDPALQGINSFAFFNQADQITDSLRGLLQGGLFGSLLAVAILYLFLRRVGMTLVVSVAIPLSILGTCIFIYLTGRTLNVLTMMGLMLGVGMLVDNAVVVLESIHRRQRRGARPVAAAAARHARGGPRHRGLDPDHRHRLRAGDRQPRRRDVGLARRSGGDHQRDPAVSPWWSA